MKKINIGYYTETEFRDILKERATSNGMTMTSYIDFILKESIGKEKIKPNIVQLIFPQLIDMANYLKQEKEFWYREKNVDMYYRYETLESFISKILDLINYYKK